MTEMQNEIVPGVREALQRITAEVDAAVRAEVEGQPVEVVLPVLAARANDAGLAFGDNHLQAWAQDISDAAAEVG